MWLLDQGSILLSRWDLLLPLLVSHLLIDFAWQSNRWVAAKRARRFAAWPLYVHGLGAGLLAWLAVSSHHLDTWRWIVPLVTTTHILIDGLKDRIRNESRAFLLDQAMHLIVLAVVVLILNGATHPNAMVRPHPAWVILFAFLVVWSAAGTMLGVLTRTWHEALQDDGLASAGLWIGRLERLLIVVFVLAGTMESVGWLVAAKSILRFPTRIGNGDRDDRHKRTEYVLVGTMASFAIALLTGLLARYLLD